MILTAISPLLAISIFLNMSQYFLFPRGLSENPHLPFDMPFDKLTVPSNVEGLTALSKAEGLRYPHPSSLRRNCERCSATP
jgi:hypothetical protein